MRGTDIVVPYPGTYTRIIPACAGNSRFSVMLELLTSDHPRVCGEQGYLNAYSYHEDGSSPRVRGTENVCDSGKTSSRIIPACAGNSDRP